MAEDFFLPSAVVVGEYADARGTEAVKLSVKLLSGLTLMALVAVGIVGLSHSAKAADTTGKVYVTNKASGLTTEPSTAVAGRTSASTVYGTYADLATTARDIVTDSDMLIVTVVDADLNVTSVTSSVGYDLSTGSGNVVELVGTGFNAPGETVQVILDQSTTSPIVGGLGDILIYDTTTTTPVAGVSAKSIVFAGNGTNPAIITLGVDFGTGPAGLVDIAYPTSQIDTVTVGVKSVVASTNTSNGPLSLLLTETGRNTGRFEGTIQVVQYQTGVVTQGVNNTSVPASGGPLQLTYIDGDPEGSAVNTPITATYPLDTTPPSPNINLPASGSESQNRLPSFSGTVADAQSGLDTSTLALFIDDSDDAGNGLKVINPLTGLPADVGDQANIPTAPLGSDGVSTVSWAFTQSTNLPSIAGVPDHLVDFQLKMSDLAGNVGYSDSDVSNTDATATGGRHGNQPHVIKIDQKIPSISSAETGIGLDTSVSPTVDKENVRDTIKVTFDGNVKDTSISASDFQVTLDSGVVFVPASVLVKGPAVYIDLDSTIPSNDTPLVSIQGTVQDLAGNSTDAGSVSAVDKLDPVLTVTRSAGTGTGTGGEAADSLTKKNMTFTITSDENLQGPPTLILTSIAGPTTLFSGLPTAQGGNTWAYTFDGSSSPNGSVAVKVTATDTASNAAEIGNTDKKAYTIDTALANPVVTPTGSTTQSNPFLTNDYSADGLSISIVSATLDGVDVTSQVIPSADSKTFFFQPTTALTNAQHKFEVKAVDAAGNENTFESVFTKSDRTDFVLELFAGWNVISVPSNPLDTDINSVFSNVGVKQVVAYDATTPAQPWRIASKVGAAAFTSQTTPGLTAITAGPGFWVETADFEDQKIALEGPTGPGDARPGLTTIPTGKGWNLVGVVDQSRVQTQAANKGTSLVRPQAVGADATVTSSTYFNTVLNGRAYTFDTVSSEFESLAAGNPVTIGSGIWVFISPQTNGQLPHIVP